MSISVEVRLLSGKRTCVNAGLDEEVGTLQLRAQAALGVRRGRLLDSSGGVLDASTPVKTARLQNADSLTLHISRVQVCGGQHAFAAILGDGTVVTWGEPQSGGDSSAVQDRLQNVHQIQANDYAFAAILVMDLSLPGVVLAWVVTVRLCSLS